MISEILDGLYLLQGKVNLDNTMFIMFLTCRRTEDACYAKVIVGSQSVNIVLNPITIVITHFPLSKSFHLYCVLAS